MRIHGNWLDKIRRKFLQSSSRNRDILVHSNACLTHGEEEEEEEDRVMHQLLNTRISQPTKEDIAAAKIQANFRGHLATRAFRAPRSLVKLQALARGANVRKQTRIALQCMQALVRLQVRIRARQLLNLNTSANR